MTPLIDLLFPALGTRLPTDHGYSLYSCVSRVLPCLHDGTVPFALRPDPALKARSVTFKHSTEPEQFLNRAKAELDRLGIRCRPQMMRHTDRAGQFVPYRHVLRVKDRRIVCYPLRVEGLSPED